MDFLAVARTFRAETHFGVQAPLASVPRLEAQDGVYRLSVMGPIHWWFVDLLPLAEELVNLRPQTIEMHVDSPGGSIFDALALRGALDMLAADGTEIRTTAGGMVASAATFLYLAGSERTQQPYTRTLVHDVRGWLEIYGTSEQIAQQAAEFQDALAAARESVLALYEASAPGAPWAEWMSGETWLSTDDMLSHGLSTAVFAGTDDDDDDDDKENAAADDLTASYLDTVRNSLRKRRA